MTRAFDVLMRFARGCSKADDSEVPKVVREAAGHAIVEANKLRAEDGILYIADEGGEVMYFGSKEAVTAWVKKKEGRSYRTESLLF